MKKVFSAVITAALITACATPYDQKKSAWTGGVGYSESQLGPDIWQVDFTGNTYTDRETTKKFTLRKAAEIAQREGYPYFKSVDAETARDVTGASNTGYYNTWGASQSYADSKTSTTMTVQLLKSKEGQQGIIYDAAFMLKSVPTK